MQMDPAREQKAVASLVTTAAMEAQQRKPKHNRLGAVKKGRLKVAHSYLFYGSEGVGKSSLAADAPSPIFIDVEGGADSLDVDRYTWRDDARGHVPRSFGEVMLAIEELITGEHDYKTVVIDTVDALETLIHKDVCATEKIGDIGAIGFGRGPKIALESIRLLLAALERLKARGVSVVLLGHSAIKAMRNPTGEAYDRYQLRVDKEAAEQIKSWVDVVGFVRFQDGASKAGKNARAIGWSTGDRLISLKHEAAWDGKSRLTIAEEITLTADHPWAPFGAAVSETEDTSDAELMQAIEVELARVGEFKKSDGTLVNPDTVRTSCTKAPRSQVLRVLQMLRDQPATATKEEK